VSITDAVIGGHLPGSPKVYTYAFKVSTLLWSTQCEMSLCTNNFNRLAI